MQAKRVFARFLIFGFFGLLLEVCSGAVGDALRADWDLRGNTSLWMIFDYGLLGVVLMPLARPMIRRRVPLVARAVVYMTGIFVVEYVSGVIFHFGMGLRVWNYDHLPYNLHGQIAPHFVIPWYLLGLAAEFLHRRVDTCAVALVRGFTAQRLLELEPQPSIAERADAT